MNAGKLRHRVTLQSNSPTVADSGARSDSWSDEATVWAAAENAGGGESLQEDQVQATLGMVWRIRYYSGVKAGWRVKFGTRYFDVNHVEDVNERNIEMRLHCTEATE